MSDGGVWVAAPGFAVSAKYVTEWNSTFLKVFFPMYSNIPNTDADTNSFTINYYLNF